jgi:hypothetical protein
VLLGDHGGLAKRRSLLLGSDDGLGGRWHRRPSNFLDRPTIEGGGATKAASAVWSGGASTVALAV